MFFLPIGDEPNDPRRVPWMNYALIGLNVAVFLLAIVGKSSSPGSYSEWIERWAYNPVDPSVATLFSSMFLHAGLMHLAGNMLFLYIFGDNVEARLGPLGYLVAYLVLGAGATLTFGAFNAGVDVPMIGASGAISGVQGLYFVACPRHKVKLFIWIIIYITIRKVNARLIMGLWFFMQDVFPLLVGQTPTGGGVAHMAHLGGFAGGLVLMFTLRPLVARIEGAAEDEVAHASKYVSNPARSSKYMRSAKKQRYDSRVSRLPPPRARAPHVPAPHVPAQPRPPPLPGREPDS